MKWRICFAAAALLSIVAVSFSARTEPADAATSCAGTGWLCFYDNGTNEYENTYVDNNYWGTFGWNDRADLFLNQNLFCRVRVYADYGGGGASYSIDIGELYAWPNVVSSNYWCR